MTGRSSVVKFAAVYQIHLAPVVVSRGMEREVMGDVISICRLPTVTRFGRLRGLEKFPIQIAKLA
jgi:hypothetical protein